MQNIFVSNYVQLEIADFKILIQKEKGANPLYGPDVLDAFSVRKSIWSPDFLLTVKDKMNIGNENWNNVVFTENQIVMKYGTCGNELVLTSDYTWRHWNLYNALDQNNMDDWFYKLGNLFSWSVLKYDAMVLHGIILEWQGKGIIITAKSGTGKTTHARLWRDYENALIINGDKALLKKENGQWYAYGIPWSGTSGECVNRRVLLNAIVFLNRGRQNVVEVVESIKTFEQILPRIIAPGENRELAQKAILMAGEIAEDISAYQLFCTPSKESVELLKRAIAKNNEL